MNVTKKGRRYNNWRAFEEAREYARGLGLRSALDWQEWDSSGRRPVDIPSKPGIMYWIEEVENDWARKARGNLGIFDLRF